MCRGIPGLRCRPGPDPGADPGPQEHTLAHTEMPGTVPGAEAAVRRLEEFLAALDTGAERVRALTDTGKKLLDEGGVHAEKVRETVESVESR